MVSAIYEGSEVKVNAIRFDKLKETNNPESSLQKETKESKIENAESFYESFFEEKLGEYENNKDSSTMQENKCEPNTFYIKDGQAYRTDNNGDAHEVDIKSELNKLSALSNGDYSPTLLPNATYEVNGHKYETDDNGKVFKKDNDNLPNIEYTINGYTYETEDNGETKLKYLSTYSERLQQTPTNDGKWEGERGESKFISDKEHVNKILDEKGLAGIEYKNGIPEFSDVSKGKVEIDDMSDNRPKNFKQADEKMAEQRGCTPREVKKWREDNNYTWHECNDRKTCQKVPSSINSTFGHLGGVSECKKDNKEDDFDE